MSVLDVPKPSWMTEELELLADQSRRFFVTRMPVPHYERWEKEGADRSREIWLKAGHSGLLGAAVPEAYGGPGGNFAHDAVITIEANRAGIDGLGRPAAQRHRHPLYRPLRLRGAEAALAARSWLAAN